MVEYVPAINPTKSVKEKPLKASPPNQNIAVTTISVVNVVIIVRESVQLVAKLMISDRGNL